MTHHGGWMQAVLLAGPLPPLSGSVWLILGGWLLTQVGRTSVPTADTLLRRVPEVV